MPKNTDIKSILIIGVMFSNLLLFSSCYLKTPPKIMTQNDAEIISEKCDIPLENFLFSWTDDYLTQSGHVIWLRVTKKNELVPLIKATDGGQNVSCIMGQSNELNILMNIATPMNKSEINAKKY